MFFTLACKTAGEGAMSQVGPWWVHGVLYENCNCQLLCPAHVSFKQRCENERCVGFWGIHITKGRFGQLVLQEQNAVVLYESPPYMHSGGWIVEIYLDAAVDEAQRRALEKILTGEAGGPWGLLAKFVATRLETRVAPIQFEDAGKRKRLRIDGALEAVLEGVESKRTGQTATLGNLFNVIHSAIQYLARGSSSVKDRAFEWTTLEKHALYSDFSWTGP
jgi:hypothetical protein